MDVIRLRDSLGNQLGNKYILHRDLDPLRENRRGATGLVQFKAGLEVHGYFRPNPD